MQNLSTVLASHPEVTELDLSGCSLTERGLEVLESIIRDTKLDTLVLRNVVLSESALRGLLQSCQASTSLHALDLSGLGDSLVDPPIDYLPIIVAWLSENSTITRLDISGVRRAQTPLAGLAAALKDHPSLRHLDLSYNLLTENSIAELAPSLQENTRLESLSLSHNDVGDDGAKILVDAIVKSNLRSLNLSSFGIAEKEGSKDIAQLLSHNNTLTHLNLSENRIRKSGAKALFNALELRNSTLRELVMDWSLVPVHLDDSIQALLSKRQPP